MWVELFVCLLLVHLVGDFLLQSSGSCKQKREKKWRSGHHYVHGMMMFALSWTVSWEIGFWWCAVVIGVTHFAIDMWKSYQKDNVQYFIIDQLFHIAILVGISLAWCARMTWRLPLEIPLRYIVLAIAVIVCGKPANIFIKLMLRKYSVNLPADGNSGFKAGGLIGAIERWLILIFVVLQRFDAIGLLIAAKSIIRFGEKETTKTEYVLAGTLMSIFIAVLTGIITQIC